MPPRPAARTALEDAVSSVIACEKAYNVASVCVRYGLSPQADDDPMHSKGKYVGRRLAQLDSERLGELARQIAADYAGADAFAVAVAALDELLRLQAGARSITEVTRRRIARALDVLVTGGDLGGLRPLHRLLEAACPWLGSMSVSMWGGTPLAQELNRHAVHNHDWDGDELFEALGAYAWSDERFGALISEVVHPLSREGANQAHWRDVIDVALRVDGFTLVEVDTISGQPIYRCQRAAAGVQGRPKNLIFASSGAKPVLVLRDAVNNDVEIAEHAELCLIYDEPFPDGVFTWSLLASWWSRTASVEPGDAAEKSLYKRLLLAVRASKSPPEYRLFRAYYAMRPTRPNLPALFPQVYLHYGDRRLVVRQRMDFLLLLGGGRRVVLEVDGSHHYSDRSGKASPGRYASMVAEDRALRLAGYDVYRFGGAELTDNSDEAWLHAFFEALFDRYSVPS